MKKRKNQHYVHQGLLRNWSEKKGEEYYIWAFDKKNKKQFNPNIRNIAAEVGFYDFNLNGSVISLEDDFSKVETYINNILKKLIKEKNICILTKDEKVILSKFVSLQYLRTLGYRQCMGDLISLMEETEDALALENFGQQITSGQKLNPETYKNIHLLFLGMYERLSPSIQNKTWILIETDLNNPFFIGDNPIALHNEIYENKLGIAVPGIEIYFPIHRTLTLAMICPYAIASILGKQSKPQGDYKKFQDDFKKAITDGTPFLCPSELLLHLNLFQTAFSERFIMSSKDDFSLMLNSPEEFYTGPRWQVRRF